MRRSLALLAPLAILAFLQRPTPAVEPPVVQLAKPHLFGTHFNVEPRIPLAADLDGDGHADLACVFPPGNGILDIGLSEGGLKMHGHAAVLHGLLGEAVAATARKGEVAWLTRDGRVGSWTGYVKGQLHDHGKCAPGDALLALEKDLIVARHAESWTRVGAGEIKGPAKWTHVAAWKDTIFWIDGQDLHRGRLEGATLTDEVREGAGKADRLVAGDFDGDGLADALVGSTLHLAKGSPFVLGGAPDGKGLLLAADVSGDGRTDLVWCRRDEDRFRGHDILVYVTYGPDSKDRDGDGLTDDREKHAGSDPLARDTDEDGIPDRWEVDGFAGFDFAAEGCHPAKKDVICYVQRRVDVDGAHVRNDVERARAYYATLKTPIQLHVRWLAPLAKEQADGKPWWDLGNANLPSSMRGLAHYITISPGGGGQSAQLGDMGGCGANALYATFLHEFGHQIGLDHTGFYAEAWCPLYTSLMNYAYNYGYDGSYDKIHYSSGELSGCVLDERELREELPFPIDKLRFLEKGPFHFKLQANGATTRIDWNRNGRFDEGKVRADINNSYSTSGGHRSTIGKTIFAPTLVSHAGKAYLYSVNRERKLERRDHQGGQAWAPPEIVPSEEPTGDPLAISHGSDLFVLLPTARGVVRVGTKDVVPSSEGCQVSAVSWSGRLLVFLWKDGKVRTSEWANGRFQEPRDFPLASTIPPGAVAHPKSGELWVGVGEDQDARRKSRWRLYRLVAKGEGFLVVGSRWLAGEGAGDAGNRRPNLIWEAAEDRLHWIATGMCGADRRGHSCFYDEMTIGDASHRDGWLLKRYYDEWTTSRSAVAACWHEDDILLACRWYGGEGDDNLFVAHEGLGIGHKPMADFDDVAHVTGYGLAHSIQWLTPKKP